MGEKEARARALKAGKRRERGRKRGKERKRNKLEAVFFFVCFIEVLEPRFY